jgi:hypothetical protein
MPDGVGKRKDVLVAEVILGVVVVALLLAWAVWTAAVLWLVMGWWAVPFALASAAVCWAALVQRRGRDA